MGKVISIEIIRPEEVVREELDRLKKRRTQINEDPLSVAVDHFGDMIYQITGGRVGTPSITRQIIENVEELYEINAVTLRKGLAEINQRNEQL